MEKKIKIPPNEGGRNSISQKKRRDIRNEKKSNKFYVKKQDNLKPNGKKCLGCDKELTGMARKHCSSPCQSKYSKKSVHK